MSIHIYVLSDFNNSFAAIVYQGIMNFFWMKIYFFAALYQP